MVYLTKTKKNIKRENLFMGLSGGVMLSSTIFSLIIPSINYKNTYIPCIIGLFLGYTLFILINKLIKETASLAITIHNIPEGICIGVVFANAIIHNNYLMLNSAIILAIGLSIQNFPEGAIISVPLHMKGLNKHRAFLKGFIAALVELAASIITLLCKNYITPIIPYSLAFAAGTMLYGITNEIFDKNNDNILNIGFIAGFVLMMLMDVFLS